MFSSKEVAEAAKARGLSVQVILHGTSFRAGGTIVLSAGEWQKFATMSVRNAGKAFDGTGYEGRGRQFSVLHITEGGEWRIATPGEFQAVPASDRMVIGVEDGAGASSADKCVRLIKVSAAAAADGALAALFDGLELPTPATAVEVRFINLTPHIVRLNDGREFPPSGTVARVAAGYSEVSPGMFRAEFGNVTGLPDPEFGVMYIVSGMVAGATGRGDVVSPATGHPDAVRVDGQIHSVPGFIVK